MKEIFDFLQERKKWSLLPVVATVIVVAVPFYLVRNHLVRPHTQCISLW